MVFEKEEKLKMTTRTLYYSALVFLGCQQKLLTNQIHKKKYIHLSLLSHSRSNWQAQGGNDIAWKDISLDTT